MHVSGCSPNFFPNVIHGLRERAITGRVEELGWAIEEQTLQNVVQDRFRCHEVIAGKGWETLYERIKQSGDLLALVAGSSVSLWNVALKVKLWECQCNPLGLPEDPNLILKQTLVTPFGLVAKIYSVIGSLRPFVRRIEVFYGGKTTGLLSFPYKMFHFQLIHDRYFRDWN